MLIQMRRPFLLIGLIALTQQGPIVTEDEAKIASCKPGQAWVDNYIKYQCFEDGSTKGIAVVGKFGTDLPIIFGCFQAVLPRMT